jgi:hypothetical protein
MNTIIAFEILRQHRWRLLAMSALGIVSAVVYFAFAERMYTVDLVAIPARHDQNFSAALGGGQALGGIGSLLGIDAGQTEQVREGMAILKSRLLIEDFIEQNNLLPILFADKWDEENNVWFDPSDPPSPWDGFMEFSNNIYTVSESPAEGTIRIKMTWRDSKTAASWANAILTLANDRLRERTIRQSEDSLNYLREELENITTMGVRQSVYSLIESQIQLRMLAKTRPDYAFTVVDPAQPKDPDDYDFPKLTILAPAGAIALPALYLLLLIVGLVFASTDEKSGDVDN